MKVLSLIIAGFFTALSSPTVAAYTEVNVENYYAYDLIDITKQERIYLKQYLQLKFNVTIPELTDEVWEAYRTRYESVLQRTDARFARGNQLQKFISRKVSNYAGVNRSQKNVKLAIENLLQELRGLEQKNGLGDQGIATKILGDREAIKAAAETKDLLEKKLATQEFIKQGYSASTGKLPPLPSNCSLRLHSVVECDPLNKLAFDELANYRIKFLTETLQTTERVYAEIRDDFNRNFNNRLPIYIEILRDNRKKVIEKEIAKLERYLRQPSILWKDEILHDLIRYSSGYSINEDKLRADLKQKKKDLATIEEELAERFAGMLERRFTPTSSLKRLREALEKTKTILNEYKRTGSEPLTRQPYYSIRNRFILTVRDRYRLTRNPARILSSYQSAMQKNNGFESSMSTWEKKSIVRKYTAKKDRQ